MRFHLFELPRGLVSNDPPRPPESDLTWRAGPLAHCDQLPTSGLAPGQHGIWLSSSGGVAFVVWLFGFLPAGIVVETSGTVREAGTSSRLCFSGCYLNSMVPAVGCDSCSSDLAVGVTVPVSGAP
ncbi:hypothetical protein BaRGS_00019085 [Batillaria attramentaria]|uniref:Uncharacterized protein n=1 Tax=Batillaria attramentaria TaxID=370345 RepID=A0ABD0KQY9_9CAEN